MPLGGAEGGWSEERADPVSDSGARKPPVPKHSRIIDMIRLYTPDDPLAPGAALTWRGERHHYLARVLRVRVGAVLELFAGDGRVYGAEVVRVETESVTVEIRTVRAGLPSSPARVTLVQAVLRGKRLDHVVQKTTELGVASIALVTTARTEVNWSGDRAGRMARLRTIAAEAAEQCGRAEVPDLRPPVPLCEIVAARAAADRRVVLWEEARDRPLCAALAGVDAPCRIILLSGPEGGLTQAEVARCEEGAFAPAGLGPRILRAETAPLAALSVVQATLGDLGVSP